jgi:hypothetical protein
MSEPQQPYMLRTQVASSQRSLSRAALRRHIERPGMGNQPISATVPVRLLAGTAPRRGQISCEHVSIAPSTSAVARQPSRADRSARSQPAMSRGLSVGSAFGRPCEAPSMEVICRKFSPCVSGTERFLGADRDRKCSCRPPSRRAKLVPRPPIRVHCTLWPRAVRYRVLHRRNCACDRLSKTRATNFFLLIEETTRGEQTLRDRRRQ